MAKSHQKQTILGGNQAEEKSAEMRLLGWPKQFFAFLPLLLYDENNNELF